MLSLANSEVDDLTTQFYIRGWKPHDNVGIFLHTSTWTFYLSFLAAARLGMSITLGMPLLFPLS
jgi:hypothetical protein